MAQSEETGRPSTVHALQKGHPLTISHIPAAPQTSAILHTLFWHPTQTWERPEGAVVGVVGDFQAPKMLSVLESALGSWTGPGGELPAVSRDPDPLAPAAQAAGNVYLVDRQGLSQVSLVSISYCLVSRMLCMHVSYEFHAGAPGQCGCNVRTCMCEAAAVGALTVCVTGKSMSDNGAS